MASHGVPRGSGEAPTNERDRKKELKKIEDYKGLVDAVNAKIWGKQYTQESLDLTSKLLQQNPEYYTIWNCRRLILREIFSEVPPNAIHSQNGSREERSAALIQSDLAFLIPLLRKFPKCYWIWNYRLWLLEQASNRCLIRESARIWEEDMALVNKMMNLDSRNFLAWGYRRTLVAGLEAIRSKDRESSAPLTDSEIEYTTSMITSNLSNFSAWHWRSKLIPQVLAQRKVSDAARREMLDSELELVQRALNADYYDSSIWFYHQALMCNLVPRYVKDAIAPDLSEAERVEYVSNEMDMVLEMLDVAEDSKWIYQSLIDMSLLYQNIRHQWPRQAVNLPKWLDELEKLDPLRAGRWRDLRRQIISDHAFE